MFTEQNTNRSTAAGLPPSRREHPSSTILLALLLAIAATATAPAATLFTLQEYEAKGTETDTVLSVLAHE